MNTGKLIYWHNGLFLKPHHFQYLQKYTQDTVQNLFGVMNPYNWGVMGLSLDEETLKNKMLTIKEAVFVFRDGTVVSYPKNAIVVARDFSKSLKDGKKLKCYIGLKKLSSIEANVSEIEDETQLKNINTRFVCNRDKTINVNNLYQNDDPVDMINIDHFLRIFFEEELDAVSGYELLPLNVIEDKGGEIFISDQFSPPTLNLFSDKNLQTLLGRVYEYLFSHANQLEEYKTPHQFRNKELVVSKHILALNSICEYVSAMDTYITVGQVHPAQAYATLTALVSKLSVFTDRVNVLGRTKDGAKLLSAYNHEEPYTCFAEAKRLIDELLDDIIIGPDYIIPFVRNKDIYTVELMQEILTTDKFSFFLSIKSDELKSLDNKVRYMKISTIEEIGDIVQRALPGVSFSIQETPPAGLPRKKETTYVQINTTQDAWFKIKSHQNMAVAWNNVEDNLDIKLIVIEK